MPGTLPRIPTMPALLSSLPRGITLPNLSSLPSINIPSLPRGMSLPRPVVMAAVSEAPRRLLQDCGSVLDHQTPRGNIQLVLMLVSLLNSKFLFFCFCHDVCFFQITIGRNKYYVVVWTLKYGKSYQKDQNSPLPGSCKSSKTLSGTFEHCVSCMSDFNSWQRKVNGFIKNSWEPLQHVCRTQAAFAAPSFTSAGFWYVFFSCWMINKSRAD